MEVLLNIRPLSISTPIVAILMLTILGSYEPPHQCETMYKCSYNHLKPNIPTMIMLNYIDHVVSTQHCI